MALSPQKFREIVFQLLYSHDFLGTGEEEMEALLMRELAVTKKVLREAEAKRLLVQEKLTQIDRLIAETSSGYDFDRIPRVERNILRLGVYELLYEKNIPRKVIIAEALRLAKKFATPEAVSFVNAILDSIPDHPGQ